MLANLLQAGDGPSVKEILSALRHNLPAGLAYNDFGDDLTATVRAAAEWQRQQALEDAAPG